MSRFRLKFFRPYPRQLEHLWKGKDSRFRLLMAGNRVGKSETGSAEVAMHLTGIYPENWKGKTFERAIKAWVGGVTSVSTRDICQSKLLGPPGSIGTGWIPGNQIVKLVPSRGNPGAYEYVLIKHTSGGTSELYFKSYEQGREKWQGVGVHVIWLDEEPPMAIWNECLARVPETEGIIVLTFTPLKGLSEVVRTFYPYPDSHEKAITRMELEEARHDDGSSHLADEEVANMKLRYPPYEREARQKGIPVLGSGLIYAVSESEIIEPPPTPGPFWARIIGLDLGGGEHATAFTLLGHDRDTDCVHVLHTYKAVDAKIAVHAAAINSTSPRVPVAWPKDAHIRDRNDGRKFADIYRQHGTFMLRDHAQWPDGSVGVEAGLAEILNRMVEGRFKCSYNHQHFWEEVRVYHRRNGVVHKQFDDTMDSLRYGMMMLRYAKRIRERSWPSHARSIYDPLDSERSRQGRMN